MKFMELYNNIAEYYDELYPASDDLKDFYKEESKKFTSPIKYLSIGCGTGTFEHYLAKGNCDVTGLETVPSLIESANRKRRTQLMALRFFNMTSLEMCRFLGKSFYNVISIPNGRIAFTHDPTLMSKLFYDCKQLLAPGGKLILHLPNFDKFKGDGQVSLPVRESIRVKLFSKITTTNSGKKMLFQNIEKGNGKNIIVTEDAEIMPLTKTQIEQFAKNVGFIKLSFYSSFTRSEFTPNSDELIAVIS